MGPGIEDTPGVPERCVRGVACLHEFAACMHFHFPRVTVTLEPCTCARPPKYVNIYVHTGRGL